MKGEDYIGIGGVIVAGIAAYVLLNRPSREQQEAAAAKAAEDEAEFEQKGAIGSFAEWFFGKNLGPDKPAQTENVASPTLDVGNLLNSIGPAGMGLNAGIEILKNLLTPSPPTIPEGATVQPGGLVTGGSNAVPISGAGLVSGGSGAIFTVLPVEGSFAPLVAVPPAAATPPAATTLNIPSGYTSYSSYSSAQSAAAVANPIQGKTFVTYPNGVMAWV